MTSIFRKPKRRKPEGVGKFSFVSSEIMARKSMLSAKALKVLESSRKAGTEWVKFNDRIFKKFLHPIKYHRLKRAMLSEIARHNRFGNMQEKLNGIIKNFEDQTNDLVKIRSPKETNFSN